MKYLVAVSWRPHPKHKKYGKIRCDTRFGILPRGEHFGCPNPARRTILVARSGAGMHATPGLAKISQFDTPAFAGSFPGFPSVAGPMACPPRQIAACRSARNSDFAQDTHGETAQEYGT